MRSSVIGTKHQAAAANGCVPLGSAAKLFGFCDFGSDPLVRAGNRAVDRAGLKRLVHDLADGARAPPTLRAAAKAAIHLIGGGGPGRGAVDHRTDFAVGQNVAGTNNHQNTKSSPGGPDPDLGEDEPACKKKSSFWMDSKLRRNLYSR